MDVERLLGNHFRFWCSKLFLRLENRLVNHYLMATASAADPFHCGFGLSQTGWSIDPWCVRGEMFGGLLVWNAGLRLFVDFGDF